MASISTFRQRLKAISKDQVIFDILFAEIKRYENIFLNLNKKSLGKGESSTGEIFGTYSQLTEQIASQENPRKPKRAGELYNFEYTGGLFDGMELVFGNNEVLFTSTDSKTAFLRVKYPDLFGIQDEDKKEVIQKVILPAFINQIRLKLNV